MFSFSVPVKKAQLGLSLHDSESSFGNTTGTDDNQLFTSLLLCTNLRHVFRTALTGFRSGWQHLKATALSTFAVNSNTEAVAQVDQFDYAADASDDDNREDMWALKSIRKSTEDETSLAKVCSTKFHLN